MAEAPEANAQSLVRRPVGGWGRMEEIAVLVCCLCRDAVGFVTGTEIMIDGGWTANGAFTQIRVPRPAPS
jgi:NAD(P)-dependent dehydrogenase (short-subunit alcohol dehydrogenase family)